MLSHNFNNRLIFYIGDTVSDTLTVMNAKKVLCDEKIISVGIIANMYIICLFIVNKNDYHYCLVYVEFQGNLTY